ncbi:DNA-methyltransferase [Anaerolinea thermophila]|uniref:Methyltransferase n=1 Tax=Anaerolinea thermophila (strain DSM 14523 / JCM 11388 / NBRC 100420 / UNI-1) TaxID=926569 RepID=E8N0X3_ANATU|nr:site-specific DNA-methyltransferase [Anaerolinea thermophila]BAJ62518.1 methyltransferase [Anaerolinea thermophila UNI-1]
MADYKSIQLTNFEVDKKVLDIVNNCLSQQPDPRPFVEINSIGYVFYFHTLDIKLLQRNIEMLTAHDLFSANNPSSSRKAGELLQKIYEEVSKIGSYGIRSGKRQYVNFDIERKVRNRKAKEQNRSQYYYAQDNNFSKISNQLPPEMTNQIFCGDSLEVLKKIPDNSIDLIFTSPPYNFGLEYERQDDAHKWDLYFEKLFAIFDECIRVLKFGGRIAVNIQPLFSDYIPSHHLISNFFISRRMIWKGEILWEKNNYNCKYTAWGSWKSPSNPYLKYTWEFIEIFAKGTLKKSGDPKNADITSDEFKEWVVAKWSIAPERKMKEFGHPAMFPEKLAERVIKLFSFVGDIVLDPFNGVGTTTAVAQKLGRKFIGIDISQEYCDIAQKRLKNTLL